MLCLQTKALAYNYVDAHAQQVANRIYLVPEKWSMIKFKHIPAFFLDIAQGTHNSSEVESEWNFIVLYQKKGNKREDIQRQVTFWRILVLVHFFIS